MNFIRPLLLVLTAFCLCTHAIAQADPVSAATSVAAVTPSTPTVAITSIPVADLAASADAVIQRLQARGVEEPESDSTDQLGKTLESLQKEVSSRLSETKKILSDAPSIDSLKAMDSQWQQEEIVLSKQLTTISTALRGLSNDAEYFQQQQLVWRKTLDTEKTSTSFNETKGRIKNVLEAIAAAASANEGISRTLLGLQMQFGLLAASANEIRQTIASEQAQALSGLFVRDAPPLWLLVTPGTEDIGVKAQESLMGQITSLTSYLKERGIKLVAAPFLFLLFLGLLKLVGKTLRQISSKKGQTSSTSAFLQSPLSVSFIFMVLSLRWVVSDAPSLLWAILGIAVLIPVTSLLRSIADLTLKSLFPVLGAFYLLDTARMLAVGLPACSRIIFIGELLLAAILTQLFLRTNRWNTFKEQTDIRIVRPLVFGVQLLVVLAVAAIISSIFGYTALSSLLGNAALRSAYLGACFYGIGILLNGVFEYALTVTPARQFQITRLHHQLLTTRFRLVLLVALAILWCFCVLEYLSLRKAIFQQFHATMATEIGYGAVSFSFGSIAAFIFTVTAAVYLSRLVRFVLEEEVYPRASLDRGLPYAISRVVHYAILLTGFFLAVSALGLDMTKFTILAGAFGVGMGFGLQNILNNFFSGLIVLFERPVRVGDVIQIGDMEGIVERIGIRASFIKTNHGSEVIVPNARLISDQVTNWTYSNRQRSVELSLSVAGNSNMPEVIRIMADVAKKHADIMQSPEPEVVASKFATDSVTFDLKAYTVNHNDWIKTRGEIALDIYSAFTSAGIATR